MSHAHDKHEWKVLAYVLLGLPTTEGFSERLTFWHCTTCAAWCNITGEVRHRFPLESPPFWDRLAARARPGTRVVRMSAGSTP